MPFTKDNPAIYYQKTGSGTAIIFIAPPAMGHLTFRYQTLLEDSFTVITFDNRGDCSSEHTDTKLTFSQFVDDVKRVLDENGISQAIVCGYSNGGLIAQQFALSYPEHTLALILIGGYHAPKSIILRTEYKIGIAIARKEWIPLLAKGLAFNHFSDKTEAKEIELEIKKTNADMLAQQYQLGLNYDNEDHLSHIDVPLLIIYGATDHYVHPYQNIFRKKLKDVEVAYVHRSKHQVPTKYFHECNAIIYEWTKRKQLK
ncbi:Pimeloyl-ACP methyl ester carboxylesterase [Gracilibacillus orientalis]|uniref:Pimeloyl-ACP methyl ester carboxylesterase n=1 Tax=Gracilibacillus orientalis TaxID=334253 RepID=A0A1I4MT89_9BACI|nr:alpha/beta hydrolase [Gracilibacillus orientalis]SFM06514.1 Pimeloyl-ACP methyl ester carboxylesterase [Gracilibacillus orientalis]